MFHWSLTGEVVCHVLPLGERPELSTWDHHLRSLTARFGLRCSEALCLTGEHIEINSDEPHIIVAGDTPGNMKSPDKVYFRPQDIKWMENLLKKGYKVLHYLWWLVHFVWTAEAMSNSVGPAAVVLDHWQWEGRLLYVHGSHQRRRKHKHGTCHFEECFKIPETGFIFTSRKGAKRDHLHFQAVYNHIRRQAARWWFPIFFMFTPIIWEDSHFDEHIFQMGWNHQLVCDLFFKSPNNPHPSRSNRMFWVAIPSEKNRNGSGWSWILRTYRRILRDLI